MAKILLVEDEINIASFIERADLHECLGHGSGQSFQDYPNECFDQDAHYAVWQMENPDGFKDAKPYRNNCCG